MFLEILCGLKVFVGTYLWSLQSLQDFGGFLEDGLSELLEKHNVVIFIIVFGSLAVLWGRIYLKLEQWVNDFVDVLVDADQVVLNEVALPDLDPLFLLLLFAQLVVDQEDIYVCIFRFLLFFLRRLWHEVYSARKGCCAALFNKIIDDGIGQ